MPGLLKKRGRLEPEIPTASLADIAFLLLIFFLVTTVIDTDTGIELMLPPMLEGAAEPAPVEGRNLLAISIDAGGAVRVEGSPSTTDALRARVRAHLGSAGTGADAPASPAEAVVSIETHRETPYDAFIQALDEVKMAYVELWDAEARRMGFASYAAYRAGLGNEDDAIHRRLPPRISIAEPEPGGEGSDPP